LLPWLGASITLVITKILHKRTQSIQKTSVKEIQQISNEKVNFCSFEREGRRTRWRSETFRRDFKKTPNVLTSKPIPNLLI